MIKIDHSPAAPVFNVIAKPNGWSKDVRSSSSQVSSDNRTDSEMARYEFWSSFCEYMVANPSDKFRTQSPSYSHWMNIAIGRSKFQISLLLNAKERKITVQLYLGGEMDKKSFDRLLSYKEEAEAAIGHALDWRRLEGKKTSTIDLYKQCDYTDKSVQPELFEWLKTYTDRFVASFRPIIKKL
ncbi:MAG: DUF4268 domain-containing protein [Prevotella sp.]|uniref:DUF4268 domain-containing protein n=1 Tax=Prevotella sp. PTAC TaxID=2736295 RepID=UPI00155340C3|nr:DUF4268 domain-containing protein [Prevotella sp. PTAC]MCX4293554.1 DUF4268 domain-containing protein [Prevotella sp.]NPD54757.1 DUF4268 domain-containing protein [Prevotella sp. PTAC]